MQTDKEKSHFYCYLLEISFDGTNYYGWQKQTAFRNTIQEILIDAFIKLTNNKDVKVLGSSRTDRGVHALSQFCKVTIPRFFDADKLLQSLRRILPDDIYVKKVTPINIDFKLMSSVASKTYQYLFLPDTFDLAPMAKHWIYPVGKKLDLDVLHKASKLFVGRHDFVNYRILGTETKTTIREIYQSYVEPVPEVSFPLPFIPKGTMRYVVEGNGFLKQMVRMMCGAIIAASQGKIGPKEIENSLKHPLKTRLSAPVPAYGLTLVQTKFRE